MGVGPYCKNLDRPGHTEHPIHEFRNGLSLCQGQLNWRAAVNDHNASLRGQSG